MDIQTEEEEAKNPAEHASDLDVAALVNSITQDLLRLKASRPSHQQCTIYKVPKQLRQTDEKSYEPELISIGPYHRGKESLCLMQVQKWKHLQSILDRNPNVVLKDYLKKIMASEAQARSCYSESIDHLGSSKFVEIMLLDGCFLVELFLQTDMPMARWRFQPPEILKEVWLQPFVSHDMLLIENQIPYFILERIYEIVAPGRELSELANLARRVCFGVANIMPRNYYADAKKDYYHLLDLFHHHCLPKRPEPENFFFFEELEPENSYISCFQLCLGKRKQPRERSSIPSVEELQEAGVKFKIKEEPYSFVDIEFDKSTGVMEIPYFFMDENVYSVFRNLIAFEQCCHACPRDCFTGYAVFMDALINTDKDIKILHRKGILEHGLGSHKKVAHFFNSISNWVLFNRYTFLLNQYKDVNEYCNTRRHTWRANLMQNYFSSPWAILSLVAALVLLLLTFIQTFFTVFQYFRPP